MSRSRRTLASMWAVLQFALPALGALAEGAFAGSTAAAAAAAHVEERSGPGCRPVHAPDCARCQSLTTHAQVVPVPAVDWTLVDGATSPVVEKSAPAGVARPALPLSRAPPRRS